MIITLENVKDRLLGRDAIYPIEYLYNGGRDERPLLKRILQPRRQFFVLQQDVSIKLSNARIITIEKGFRFDLSSVPRRLWGVTSPFGDFLFAALIHDYLYFYCIEDQRFADAEMLIWSMVLNWDYEDNIRRYRMVKWFGGSWWQKNEQRLRREEALLSPG